MVMKIVREEDVDEIRRSSSDGGELGEDVENEVVVEPFEQVWAKVAAGFRSLAGRIMSACRPESDISSSSLVSSGGASVPLIGFGFFWVEGSAPSPHGWR